MTKIDILLQGEGINDIELVSLDEGATFGDLLDRTAKGIGESSEKSGNLLYLEDEEEPVPPKRKIPPHASGKPHRVHIHRCRRIEVATTFNGETQTVALPPALTVGTAKRRIAQGLFGMDPKDAAEHVLQLTGTAERPEPDTHLGSLVGDGACALAFDLVPLTRVEG